MVEQPWFKFYPTDWRADQMLRLCSAAARGLWLECMCLMHEAKPYGHLLVNGRAISDAQLAGLTGVPETEIGGLIAELEGAGVFSRDADGVIYSRRMTRDAERSAAQSAIGKRGGNPRLRVKGTLNPPLNAPLYPGLNPPLKGGVNPRGQRLESESDSSEVISSLVRSLKGENPWTPEQKKAAWQSRICVAAQRMMKDDDYARFLTEWANGEPQACKAAEQIDAVLRAAKSKL